jgi:hypothetical protein
MSDVPQFHIGLDGFIWFIGVVESVEDPLCVGRCKVRIIGWHDADVAKLSTQELPYAFPVMPVTAAASVANYKPGDWVMGFFLDGKFAQQPMIFGVLPAVPQK